MENKNTDWLLKSFSQNSNKNTKYGDYKKNTFLGNQETINENMNYNSLIDHRNNMTFKILRSNRDEIILETNEINLPSANSLRRILLGEIETVAIEKVFFYKN